MRNETEVKTPASGIDRVRKKKPLVVTNSSIHDNMLSSGIVAIIVLNAVYYIENGDSKKGALYNLCQPDWSFKDSSINRLKSLQKSSCYLYRVWSFFRVCTDKLKSCALLLIVVQKHSFDPLRNGCHPLPFISLTPCVLGFLFLTPLQRCCSKKHRSIPLFFIEFRIFTCTIYI